MVYIILAAGLSTNFIVFALLFRRARRLSRQLRDIRAERNSEWILHALQDVQPEREDPTAQAAGGTYQPPAGLQPVRRKRHLGLYIGGLSGIAATVAETTRHAWQTHRGQLVAGAAAAILAAATAAVLIVIERQQQGVDRGEPPPAPKVTATVTHTASAASPSAEPPATSRSRASSSARQSEGGMLLASSFSASPIGREQPPDSSAAASSGDSIEPTLTSSGAPLPSGSAPPTEQPSSPAALCLGLAVPSLLDLNVCLAGGG